MKIRVFPVVSPRLHRHQLHQIVSFVFQAFFTDLYGAAVEGGKVDGNFVILLELHFESARLGSCFGDEGIPVRDNINDAAKACFFWQQK